MHAPIFLRSFASDRRHMKDSLGNWTAKPPAYGPIVAEGKFKKQFDYKFMPFKTEFTIAVRFDCFVKVIVM